MTAYENVYNSLKKAINLGVYSEKSLLPAEPQLCKMFGVSRTTVRKAVDMLTQGGYVKPQRGIGTVVLKRRVEQDVNKLSSLTETLKAKGYDVHLKSYALEIIEADEKTANKLNIEAGDKIAHVSRVTCASGVPIAIIDNYIPYIYVQGIELASRNYTSLYKMLNEEFNLIIEKSNDIIFAINATKTQGELLDVKENDALIVVDRICFNGDTAVCYDIVIARSDMYEYHVSLFNK